MFNFGKKHEDEENCPTCGSFIGDNESVEGRVIETELDDPQDIIDRYYSYMSTELKSEEDLYQAIATLFSDAYIYAFKKCMISDIDTKIEALVSIDKQKHR